MLDNPLAQSYTVIVTSNNAALNRGNNMKATYVKSGINYLPAIKSSYSGNVKVLFGPQVATVATAKKYAQIEINRLNATNSGY